jgi:hypothetical protein
VQSNTNLVIAATANIKFYINNASEGSKTGVIRILSSDINAPEFVARVNFNILPQYNLVFKSGASISDVNSNVVDGATYVLGTLQKEDL